MGFNHTRAGFIFLQETTVEKKMIKNDSYDDDVVDGDDDDTYLRTTITVFLLIL